MTRWLSAVALLAIVCSAEAQEITVDMSNNLNKLSYAAGYKIGDMFQNQKLTVMPEAVLKGINDARKNIRPPLTKAEMKIMLQDPKKFLAENIDSMAQKQQQESSLFLSANAQREGVVVRNSGLQYQIIRKGSGKSPQPSDVVKINYSGRNLKGHVFDSTYKRGTPAEFPVLSVVPGMSEGLQLMKEGAKWELYIPSNLAYANQGPMAGQTLIFEVELIEVLSADQ